MGIIGDLITLGAFLVFCQLGADVVNKILNS